VAPYRGGFGRGFWTATTPFPHDEERFARGTLVVGLVNAGLASTFGTV
jgi:hypothetical protein